MERYDLLPQPGVRGRVGLPGSDRSRNFHPPYEPLPRYPAVTHDIAVVVNEDVQNSEIEAEIRESGAPLLSGVELFDLYRGASIPEGKKSLAYTLTLPPT